MIKKFELFLNEAQGVDPNDPSVLFINGFRHWMNGGNLDMYGKDEKTSRVLSQFGHKVLYGSINWKSKDKENEIDEIRKLIENNNVKGIVGFSAGGYVSFNLSNEFKIPALSINPAMASNCSAPNLRPITESDLFPYQMVVIGEEDSKDNGGVDGDLVMDELEDMGFEEKGGDILVLDNTFHLITEQQFNLVYKEFYKKYMR